MTGVGCVFVLLLCLPVCAGEKEQALFSNTGQSDITFTDHLLAVVDVKSRPDCACRCSITKDCETFTFTKGSPTGTCRLHSGVMTSYCSHSPASESTTYRIKYEAGVDQCAAENSVCDQTCTNTGSSFTCGCNPGYELDRCSERTCNDIDECTLGTSDCEQTCSNTVGSFTCGCNPGYVLNVDGRTCQGVCGEQPDSGGWTVFQRRQDGSVDFYRNWTEYVNGFGIPGGECWLGLEAVYSLTSDGTWDLWIDLEDWDSNKRYASYSNFYLTSSTDGYRLKYDSFTGDTGDSLSSSRDREFATYDRSACAYAYKGAWWFDNCFYSHLNGEYKINGVTSGERGIHWVFWKGWNYSLKSTEMKIKRS